MRSSSRAGLSKTRHAEKRLCALGTGAGRQLGLQPNRPVRAFGRLLEIRRQRVCFQSTLRGVNQRRLTALVFGIPALAVTFAGLVWFVGRWGAPRWAGKVWIATTEPGHVRLRAQVTSFPQRSLPERPLQVSATIHRVGAAPRRLYGQTDADGYVDFEARLADGTGGPTLSLDVEGDPLIRSHSWQYASLEAPLRPGRSPGVVHLKPAGTEVTVVVRHGVLTVPVPDDIRLSWATDPGGSEPSTSKFGLELEGASGPRGERTFEVSAGDWFAISPLEHVVELTLRTPNGTSEVNVGFGLLPVVPGAIAARLTDGVLQVISPVPRPRVHVALATADRVLALDQVALAPTKSGVGGIGPPHVGGTLGFEGTLDLPDGVSGVLAREAVWAVTSSEPDFQSEAQVGWPLNPSSEGRTTRFGWGQTMDGFAEQQEHADLSRHRWRLGAWLGLLVMCVAELILVCILDRRASSVEGSDASTVARRWLWIAVCCVAAGFSGLASLFGFW